MSEIHNELVDACMARLGEVLNPMLNQKASISWRPMESTTSPLTVPEGAFVWQQAFQSEPLAAVWMLVPEPVWLTIGTRVLNDVGIDTVEKPEARNTFVEIVNQSMAGMTNLIRKRAASDVQFEPGKEVPGIPVGLSLYSVDLHIGEIESSGLVVGLQPDLENVCGPLGSSANVPAPLADDPAESAEEPRGRSIGVGSGSQTLDVLLDVTLPVSVSFGKTSMQVKDLLNLTKGSVVELDRGVNEHVDIIINDCVIARGEVVTVDGYYGVRIRHVTSRQDRWRKGNDVAQTLRQSAPKSTSRH